MRFSGWALVVSWSLLESCHGFQAVIGAAPLSKSRNLQVQEWRLYYNSPRHREYDMMELMVGGQRYEMVPLPDSMMDTTLFVGNLCEFCKDEDLSNLFQSVSSLQRLPACVVRKPNYASLGYGFVTFLTAEEKEEAIMRFHGSTFLGRSLKVEPIRDHPKMGRVKVPEHMVSYVVGAAKRAPKVNRNNNNSNNNHYHNNNNNSAVQSLRSVSRPTSSPSQEPKREVSSKERRKRKQQQEKEQLRADMEFTLTPTQQAELLRAARRGYLTLEGKGYSKNRQTNALAKAHRQYCDEREKPQIVLCKAVGVGSKRSPLDCLIVDLSPLRLTKGVGDDLVDDFMVQWKTQILAAAATTGMTLRRDYHEDGCQSLSMLYDDDNMNDNEDGECVFVDMDQGITDQIASAEAETLLEYTFTLTDDDSWATEPISRLPVVSLGIFEGERSNAKAMAKELAAIWDIPTEPLDQMVGQEAPQQHDNKREDDSKHRGSKARRHRRNENKRRRQNHQRDINMYFR